jgi:hypothetical protein
MKKILITRFAIELDSSFCFFKTKEGVTWFIHRLNLFNKTCLPSILDQEVLPSKWFIFIAKNEFFRSELAAVTESVDYIKIIEIEEYKPFKEIVVDYLQEFNLLQSVTTRLDCDDALYPDYFKRLESIYNDKSIDYLFEPQKGLSLQLFDNTIKRAAYIKKLLPPFLSFINHSGQNLHVFSFDHDKWPQHIVKNTYDKSPLWVQISHEINVSNKFGWGWMVQSVFEINPMKVQKLFPHLEALNMHKLKLAITNFINYAYRKIYVK